MKNQQSSNIRFKNNIFTTTVMILTIGPNLVGCSAFQRHPDSGYYLGESGDSSLSGDSNLSDSRFQQELTTAGNELGLTGNQKLDQKTQTALIRRIQLHRLEGRIRSHLDREIYYQFKPYFADDQQRIEFLQLPNSKAQGRWLKKRNWELNEIKYSAAEIRAVQENDILLGMAKEAVRDSWGEPDEIKTAGQSMYGNEQWIYLAFVPTPDGFKPESRIVYFESGRVAGWQRLQKPGL